MLHIVPPCLSPFQLLITHDEVTQVNIHLLHAAVYVQSMQAAKLRDSLDAEAVYKPFMTYAELLEFIKRQ